MSLQNRQLNNFNLIRLFAAIQVVFVHSINHLGGLNTVTKISKIIPGVPIFFFISGALIYQSYLRSGGDNKKYLWNRILRIYPALWVSIIVGLISVWSLGYFNRFVVNRIQLVGWIFGQATWVQFYNPDFMRSYGTGVFNGSLWTICVELQFYLLVPLLNKILREKRWLCWALFTVSVLCHILFVHNVKQKEFFHKILSASFLPWAYMFILGAFVGQNLDQILKILKNIGLTILLIIYTISMYFIDNFDKNASNGINPVSFLLLGAMVTLIAHSEIKIALKIQRFVRENDFSYGIYLYHMIVINALIYISFQGFLRMLFITVCVSAFFAIISWWLIEKKCLEYKRY